MSEKEVHVSFAGFQLDLSHAYCVSIQSCVTPRTYGGGQRKREARELVRRRPTGIP